MKTCTKCGAEKPLDEFSKNSRVRDGRQSWCKQCTQNNTIKWRQLHPETVVSYSRKSYEKNKSEVSARNKRNYENNRDIVSERSKEWRAKHPESVKESYRRHARKYPERNAAKCMRRHAAKKCAVPKWRNEFFISEAYALAALRSRMFGFKWHVDHIVPLQSNEVCGLHVEHNLQVIPAIMNIKKNNRWWPDMPIGVKP